MLKHLLKTFDTEAEKEKFVGLLPPFNKFFFSIFIIYTFTSKV